MKEILAKEGQELEIGKRGENLAACVVFDISAWKRMYGEGVVHLLHQRNGDRYPYPCAVEVDGNLVRWKINSADTAMAGRGHAELQYWADAVIVKSVTFSTYVSQAMSAVGDELPAPVKTWVDRLLQLGTESEKTSAANALAAQEAAQAAERAAKEAKDSADEIINGTLDYCTRSEAQAYADAAEAKANAYADAQIEAAIGVAIGGSY